MAAKYQLITELYRRTGVSVAKSPQTWQSFLSSACRNYKCRFDEQLLIYAQRPDAVAVAELGTWNKLFKRWVNKDSKGIAVFDPKGRRNTLKYYFDISDTHEGYYGSRPVPIWQMDERYEQAVKERLSDRFGELEETDLAETLFKTAENAVEDNLPDYLSQLKGITQDSFLEELDEYNIEVLYKRLAVNSVAFMLMSRCGLDVKEYFDREDFADIVNFNTPHTINAIGIAKGRRNTLKYYFDISDTHEGYYGSRPVPIWQMDERYEQAIKERLSDRFGELEETDLAETLFKTAENAVEDNLPDYLSQLKGVTQDSFLEELDEYNIEVLYKRLAVNNVAFMLMSRCGLDVKEYFDREDFADIVNFNTPHTINAIGIATSDISEMALREISAAIRNVQMEARGENRTFAPKSQSCYDVGRKQPERSENNEQNHIHKAGGLSYSRPNITDRARASAWQIRYDAQGVSGAAQESDLSEPAHKAGGLSYSRPNITDRARASAWQIRYDAQGVSGTAQESDLSEPADRGDAKSASLRGGTDSTQTVGASDEAALNGAGRDGETEGKSPDAVGRIDEQHPQPSGGSHLDGTDLQLSIANEEEVSANLPTVGRDGGTEGKSPDAVGRIDEQHPQPSGGSHLDGTDLQLSIANEEEVSANLPTVEQQIERITQAEDEKSSAFVVSQEDIDSVLQMGSSYDKSKYRIYRQLQKNSDSKTNIEFLKKEYGTGGGTHIFPDGMQMGSSYDKSKYRIYRQLQKNSDSKTNIEFLKKEYGTGGGTHIFPDGTQGGRWADSKGIAIEKQGSYTDPDLRLSWSKVEKRLRELIKNDRYLNPKEKDHYADYLEQVSAPQYEIDTQRKLVRQRFIQSKQALSPADKRDSLALRLSDFIRDLDGYEKELLSQVNRTDLRQRFIQSKQALSPADKRDSLALRLSDFIRDLDGYEKELLSQVNRTDLANINDRQMEEQLSDPATVQQLLDFLALVQGKTSDTYSRSNAWYFSKELTELHPMHYLCHEGDVVYLGADKYEVQSVTEDRVTLQNVQFPILMQAYNHTKLSELLNKNPANDHLKVVVTDRQKSETLTEKKPDSLEFSIGFSEHPCFNQKHSPRKSLTA